MDCKAIQILSIETLFGNQTSQGKIIGSADNERVFAHGMPESKIINWCKYPSVS